MEEKAEVCLKVKSIKCHSVTITIDGKEIYMMEGDEFDLWSFLERLGYAIDRPTSHYRRTSAT